MKNGQVTNADRGRETYLFEAAIEDLQFLARELRRSAERLQSFRFVSGHATVGILKFSGCITQNDSLKFLPLMGEAALANWGQARGTRSICSFS